MAESAAQPFNYTVSAISDVPRFHLICGSGSNALGMLGALAVAKAGSIVGVNNTETRSGDAMTVVPVGKAKAVAGGALATIGTRLTCTASGRLAAAGSGDTIIGINLEAAGADGDVITVFMGCWNDKMIA